MSEAPPNNSPRIKLDMIITIDGPSGAGKSTVSKSVALLLGYTYLDTGAMYRAAALEVRRKAVDINDASGLESLLRNTDIRIENTRGDNLRVILNGEDITDKIRTPEISRLSSDIATRRAVREKLVELQRNTGRAGNIVAEGRDMGTYVFPDADFKFFLEASLDERARRRCKQLLESGSKSDIREVKNELEIRDRQDRERSESPLHPSPNAVIIDTTNLLADEVISMIIKEVQG
ncbi:MAG: (d)CMP kinase [Deltaproteobacteria bacterium]